MHHPQKNDDVAIFKSRSKHRFLCEREIAVLQRFLDAFHDFCLTIKHGVSHIDGKSERLVLDDHRVGKKHGREEDVRDAVAGHMMPRSLIEKVVGGKKVANGIFAKLCLNC